MRGVQELHRATRGADRLLLLRPCSEVDSCRGDLCCDAIDHAYSQPAVVLNLRVDRPESWVGPADWKRKPSVSSPRLQGLFQRREMREIYGGVSVDLWT